MKNIINIIYDEEGQPKGWFTGNGFCDSPNIKLSTTEDPDYLHLIKKLEDAQKGEQ